MSALEEASMRLYMNPLRLSKRRGQRQTISADKRAEQAFSVPSLVHLFCDSTGRVLQTSYARMVAR